MTAGPVHLEARRIAASDGAPFRFTHDLAGDERFSVDALADLAGRMPVEDVEMNAADLPDVYPTDDIPPLDVAPSVLVRRLEELRRWTALSYVERDPEFGQVVDECVGPLVDGLDDFEGGVSAREGYVFVSAASATTPAHLDYEHNVFLQIAGSKEIAVGFLDAEAEARTLEAMHGGHYGRAPYLPEVLETFRLEPGDGMYISPGLVHMVRNVGDSLSISLSLVIKTSDLDRGSRVYAANHDLRRIGLDPVAPGRSAARDAAKSAAVLAWRRAKGLLGRGSV